LSIFLTFLFAPFLDKFDCIFNMRIFAGEEKRAAFAAPKYA